MGSEGSGKTCFFAGLAWLGDAVRGGDFHNVVGLDNPTQAFLNVLRGQLDSGNKPLSTHETRSLRVQVEFRDQHMELDAEDFAGEEFRAAGVDLPDDDPFAANIRKAEYILMFLDIQKDVDGDPAANTERLNAVANLLARHARNPKLAVILSKADMRDGARGDNPGKYLKAALPGFFSCIQALGFDMECFFLASLGKSELSPGNPPEPLGYGELFEWMVGQRHPAWWKRHTKAFCWALLLGLVAAGGWMGIRHHAGKAVESGLPISVPISLGAPEESFDKRANALMGEIAKALPHVTDFNTLQGYLGQIDGLGDKCSNEMAGRLAQTKTAIADRREDIHLERILRLAQEVGSDGRKHCREAIAEYEMDTNRSARRRAEVTAISKRLAADEDAGRRAEIRGAIVVAGNPDTLRRRCDLVEAYPIKADSEKQEAARAVAVARKFLEDAPYDVTIESAKMLVKSRRTRLVFTQRGRAEAAREVETDYVDARNPAWNKKFQLRWKPGDTISLHWQWEVAKVFAETTIGHASFADPWTSLLDILGGCDLEPSKHRLFHTTTEDIPNVTISCSQFPDPKNDLRLFRKYISPGDYWLEDGP
jgi:hypothetical protein